MSSFISPGRSLQGGGGRRRRVVGFNLPPAAAAACNTTQRCGPFAFPAGTVASSQQPATRGDGGGGLCAGRSLGEGGQAAPPPLRCLLGVSPARVKGAGPEAPLGTHLLATARRPHEDSSARRLGKAAGAGGARGSDYDSRRFPQPARPESHAGQRGGCLSRPRRGGEIPLPRALLSSPPPREEPLTVPFSATAEMQAGGAARWLGPKDACSGFLFARPCPLG